MPKRSAFETSHPGAFRRCIARYWHPLGCRSIEPGKPPRGGVICTVIHRTAIPILLVAALRAPRPLDYVKRRREVESHTPRNINRSSDTGSNPRQFGEVHYRVCALSASSPPFALDTGKTTPRATTQRRNDRQQGGTRSAAVQQSVVHAPPPPGTKHLTSHDSPSNTPPSQGFSIVGADTLLSDRETHRTQHCCNP